MITARIKKYGDTWNFLSEADLEDFIWSNLKELLGIQPLLRQYLTGNQNRCDMLALDHNGRLFILELKKGIDDGIVSQLTRYYESITKNPLTIKEFNKEQGVSLIAISNDFHRNSLLDAQYSRLDFRFLRYSIQEKNGKLLFQLLDHLDDAKIAEFPIEAAREEFQELSPPSRLFSRLLQLCNKAEAEAILEARKKILLFDHRLKEVNKQGYILWSQGKTLPLAELRLDSERDKTFLYLYLPFRKTKGR